MPSKQRKLVSSCVTFSSLCIKLNDKHRFIMSHPYRILSSDGENLPALVLNHYSCLKGWSLTPRRSDRTLQVGLVLQRPPSSPLRLDRHDVAPPSKTIDSGRLALSLQRGLPSISRLCKNHGGSESAAGYTSPSSCLNFKSANPQCQRLSSRSL